MKHLLLLLPCILSSCGLTVQGVVEYPPQGNTPGAKLIVGGTLPWWGDKKLVEPPLPSGDGSGKTPVLVSPQ